MTLFTRYYASSLPGNVAFDAFSLSATTEQNTSPMTLSHTPVGTPAGVVVFIVGTGQSVDEVTGVTYGGVSMTRVPTNGLAQDTAVEIAATYCYTLFSSIPTGTQDVSVAFDTGAPNAIKIAACTTLTGVGTLSIADSGKIEEDAATPLTVTLDPAGANSIAVAGLYSGRTDDTFTSPATGMTEDGTYNFGSYHAAFGHQTTPGTASFAAGWVDPSADDVAMIAVMVEDPGT